ncbi:hypothetical protein [Streptomyces sp. NPDC002328]|uniref:hypothetical protein n=1 Tax=Streptomyces sp. NPDC002328 TaxID=3364642 RepID=UPI0036C92422
MQNSMEHWENGENSVPEADRHDALLVRDVMEHTVAELAPVGDLVRDAVVQGRRRRARRRFATAAGVVCAAGAVVFASVTLPGGGDGGERVGPAASGAPSPGESLVPDEEPAPYRTPVHIKPTDDEESTMADLPAAERSRQEDFQQQAAVLLDELLPNGVGLIRPVDLSVRRYQGETEDGKVFPVIFSVRPSAEDSGPNPCPAPGTLNGGTCEQATLPGGLKATAYRILSDSPTTTATLVHFAYGSSEVELTVNPDPEHRTSAPVTTEQLLSAAADSRLLNLVRYADEHPMQEEQRNVNGG